MMGEPEIDLLERIDFFRLDAGRKLQDSRKASLGQFLTPAPVARLMASMLESRAQVRLLDAGAGVGSLFAACVAELCGRDDRPEQIHVTAYEIDEKLADYLPDTFRLCQAECERFGVRFSFELLREDFLASAADVLTNGLFATSPRGQFSCAVLNPPYRKINTNSRARRLLQGIGVETTNLYAGFLAAAVRLLEPGGELVSITPRSFCNGSYFRRFRRFFLGEMSLRWLHVFESRHQAFRDDEVLQENVVLRALKGGKEARVFVTSGSGPEDELPLCRVVPYGQVVRPDDPQSFIHITPDALGQQVAKRMAEFSTSLDDLGLSVSTGRVVEFRAKDSLRRAPAAGTAPLIHPTHLVKGAVHWPKEKTKRHDALAVFEHTEKLLIPNRHYVLVKRFSAKEEKRRVVAAVHSPDRVPGPYVGFENHLNYYHCNGGRLAPTLAKGLAAFLNSTLVDMYFRQFNGHTQVNATDLRSLRYPTRAQLLALGARVGDEFPGQAELDDLIDQELPPMAPAKGGDAVRAKKRTDEALDVLRALGFPRQQLNERSALTLLALLGLKPTTPWPKASAPLCGVTPMMEFFAENYGKAYKPNTREMVRRQTVHQFLDAGLIVANPDDPGRPVNSPKAVYQVEASALKLLRSYGSAEWEKTLVTYLASVETLKKRYARERTMTRIPVVIAPGKTITLSPGGQNVLVKHVLDEFVDRFTPGGKLIYVGDTEEKFAYFDQEGLAGLGVVVERHGKMPDVIVHYVNKNWLVLIEAVTSHGPIDAKRRQELQQLFSQARAGLVFVTAFLSRKAMMEYLDAISWETEVWVAEAPTHLIHFNGERFLGPHPA
jgi:adenine-specific DNA-methyltransferase